MKWKCTTYDANIEDRRHGSFATWKEAAKWAMNNEGATYWIMRQMDTGREVHREKQDGIWIIVEKIQ